MLELGTPSIEPRHDTKVFEIPKYSGEYFPSITADVKVYSIRKRNVSTLRASMFSTERTSAEYPLGTPNSRNVLTARFHYLISDRELHRQELSIRPTSATSARGKLVSWKSRLLALIYEGRDIVVLDLHSATEVGRIEGAGGPGCQEVLYDVSNVCHS